MEEQPRIQQWTGLAETIRTERQLCASVPRHGSIIAASAQAFESPLKNFYSPNRYPRALVLSRFLAFYLLRERTALTLVQIGNLCGRRDHTTVLHGIKIVRMMLQHGNIEMVAPLGEVLHILDYDWYDFVPTNEPRPRPEPKPSLKRWAVPHIRAEEKEWPFLLPMG